MAGSRRNRAHVRLWKLFGVAGPLGATVLRMVTWEAGERLLADGEAKRLHDPQTGRCLGFQRMKTEIVKTRKTGESLTSECALTRWEIELVAGQAFRDGKSRTLVMSETRRRTLLARGIVACDAVEEALVKLQAFAPVYRA
jgi:hypothetical protein